MDIASRLNRIKKQLEGKATVVAVTKTRTEDEIMQAYNTGHRIFGENKAQELKAKYEALPKDIEWHMIGHLQTNKVKYIAPFVTLIQSVDSIRLLAEIDKRAKKAGRVIDYLLEIHIARESTKSGFQFGEAFDFIEDKVYKDFPNTRLRGLMGMASNTDIQTVVQEEFGKLNHFYCEMKPKVENFDILSMGMTNDYKIAVKMGSNMVRIGSAIFGERKP